MNWETSSHFIYNLIVLKKLLLIEYFYQLKGIMKIIKRSYYLITQSWLYFRFAPSVLFCFVPLCIVLLLRLRLLLLLDLCCVWDILLLLLLLILLTWLTDTLRLLSTELLCIFLSTMHHTYLRYIYAYTFTCISYKSYHCI